LTTSKLPKTEKKLPKTAKFGKIGDLEIRDWRFVGARLRREFSRTATRIEGLGTKCVVSELPRPYVFLREIKKAWSLISKGFALSITA